MSDPKAVLAELLRDALAAAFGAEHAGTDPLIRPSQFADFQANVALPLGKALGRPPREVATAIAGQLDAGDVCAKVEVSGPGFLNLTLRDEWLAAQAAALAADPRCGAQQADVRDVIPIDYSAPNVAKEMHVGHLRTTVVGDALARTLEFRGHRVIRQNHLGDWGTPFGMLIEHLLDVGEHSEQAELLQSDPNAFYQAAREKFDNDEGFADRARRRVVALQAGDADTLRLWQELVDLSKVYFNRIYRMLDVTLTDDDLAGESIYNEWLAEVCDELEAKGLATVSQGALCVFLDGYTGREGNPVPLIVRKSDGGYGYATTDLAAVRYRVRDLGATRIVYVIGAPQSLHLSMVYETARLAGWLPPEVAAIHVAIGNVLGEDGKLLRTRSGAPVRLMALLEEAVERALTVVRETRPELDAPTHQAIAHAVGVGAVKYADLSTAHDTGYVFDFDRMLALSGNTGPYLQYAAARARSIFRKAGIKPEDATAPVRLDAPAERALALQLLGFGAAVAEVDTLLEPHRLCTYLFDLASAFTTFYEQCPVLKADDPVVRESRLTLCAASLRTLVTGLDLLGVTVPDQM